jgi:hypothetical protein
MPCLCGLWRARRTLEAVEEIVDSLESGEAVDELAVRELIERPEVAELARAMGLSEDLSTIRTMLGEEPPPLEPVVVGHRVADANGRALGMVDTHSGVHDVYVAVYQPRRSWVTAARASLRGKGHPGPVVGGVEYARGGALRPMPPLSPTRVSREGPELPMSKDLIVALRMLQRAQRDPWAWSLRR